MINWSNLVLMFRRFHYCLCFYLLIGFSSVKSQTLGGRSSYQFMRFPVSAQASALGGMNVSQQNNDLSLAFHNPALLSPESHSQMAASFNSMYDGVKQYHWMQGYRHPKLKTNFAAGISFFNYGDIVETDPSGNSFGTIRPRDYVVQLSASREYLNRWTYGITVKYIGSNYGAVRSSALAADVGLLYRDTANFLQIGFVAMNMGSVLKKYSPGVNEELPFDLVFGISKKLAKAPIQFSLTAHHLHRFNLLYNDTLFNQEIGDPFQASKGFTIDKLFRHFIFSTQLFIGKKIEVTVGYNYLRRTELRLPNYPNGLVGFSLGAGAILPKLHLRYGRTYYQNTTAYNQLSLNLPLNRYFGFGKWGEKHGW